MEPASSGRAGARHPDRERRVGGGVLRWLGTVLSPGGPRGRLTILTYHRILAAPDPILYDEIDAGTFEAQMALLAAAFNVLPLAEACERLARGALPARAACLTFDDGYADNERTALPILRRHGLPATFFVATGYTDGGIMFNDAVIEAVRAAAPGPHDLTRLGLGRHDLGAGGSRRAMVDAVLDEVRRRPPRERAEIVAGVADALRARLPGDLMMTSTQVKRLSDEGMEIGGHTTNHPVLAALGEAEARSEIEENKRRLEDITGAPVRLFAYPNGKPGRDYRREHVALVRQAGYRAAVSTAHGTAGPGCDPYQLPRMSPWERRPLRLAARMLAASALGRRPERV
ncbi:MAG: polysaccharide deacetylase family protein [Burkholderiales bacterium]|nr:polysaccharide deacetylase family protein [Burkholderiales bacterium]